MMGRHEAGMEDENWLAKITYKAKPNTRRHVGTRISWISTYQEN